MSNLPIIVQEGEEIEFPKFGKFTVGEFFRSGANAKVHLCSSNNDYVIKIHNARKLIDKRYDDSYTVEHKLEATGTNLCVPFAHTFIDLQKDRYSLVLLMESLTDCVMLQEFMRANPNIHSSTCVSIIHKILLAYQGLHQQDCLHGDVSERNILINQNSEEIKIIDFEWAVKDFNNQNPKQKVDDVLGVPELVSPEVRMGEIKTRDSEFWSLCVIFLKLIEHKVAKQIRQIDSIGVINWIKEDILRLDEPLYRFHENHDIPDEVLKIIEQGTTPNPEYRTTIDDLISALPEISNHPKIIIQYPDSYKVLAPNRDVMGAKIIFDSNDIIKVRKGKQSNMTIGGLTVSANWPMEGHCTMEADFMGHKKPVDLVEGACLIVDDEKITIAKIDFLS